MLPKCSGERCLARSSDGPGGEREGEAAGAVMTDALEGVESHACERAESRHSRRISLVREERHGCQNETAAAGYERYKITFVG